MRRVPTTPGTTNGTRRSGKTEDGRRRRRRRRRGAKIRDGGVRRIGGDVRSGRGTPRPCVLGPTTRPTRRLLPTACPPSSGRRGPKVAADRPPRRRGECRAGRSLPHRTEHARPVTVDPRRWPAHPQLQPHHHHHHHGVPHHRPSNHPTTAGRRCRDHPSPRTHRNELAQTINGPRAVRNAVDRRRRQLRGRPRAQRRPAAPYGPMIAWDRWRRLRRANDHRQRSRACIPGCSCPTRRWRRYERLYPG